MLAALRSPTSLKADAAEMIENFGLEEGVDYVVYGELGHGEDLALLLPDQTLSWLLPVDADILYLLSPGKPRGWMTRMSSSGPVSGPNRLCSDPTFLEALTDGDPEAREIFRGWRYAVADFLPSEANELLRRRTADGRKLDVGLAEVAYGYQRGWIDNESLERLALAESSSEGSASWAHERSDLPPVDLSKAQAIRQNWVHALGVG